MSKTELQARRMKDAFNLFQDPNELANQEHKDLLHKLLQHQLNVKEYTDFESLGKRARETNAKSASAIFDSYRNRYLLDRAAAAQGWEEEERPKFWWMRGPFPGNFGDILTPFLIWNLYKVPVRWAPCAKSDCLAIGSIAKCATPGIKMWGAGIAHPDHAIEPKAEWLAVRGPETQKALRKNGAKVPEAMGDPALLLPRAYQPKVKKTGYGLIIPHYTHVAWFQKSIHIKTKLDAEQVRILSPIVNGFEGIREFCDQVASADWVVASSLHGLIVAHAYGVPAAWAMPERSAPQGPNDSIKYTDYMSSVGLPTNLSVVQNWVDLDEVIDRARPVAKMPDLDVLQKAFPYATLRPAKENLKADTDSIFHSDRSNNIRVTIIKKTTLTKEEGMAGAPETPPKTDQEAKRAARVKARKEAKAASKKDNKAERKAARKQAKVAARKEVKAAERKGRRDARIAEKKAKKKA